MDRFEIIPYKVRVNILDGLTVSIFSVTPYGAHSDWEIREKGFSIRDNRAGITGYASHRYPGGLKTREAADDLLKEIIEKQGNKI